MRETEVGILTKEYLITQLDQMIDGKDRTDTLAVLKRRIRHLTSVTDYEEYNRKSEASYQEMCLAITETMNKDAKSMSVIEYEAAVKMMTERAKRMEQHTRKH